MEYLTLTSGLMAGISMGAGTVAGEFARNRARLKLGVPDETAVSLIRFRGCYVAGMTDDFWATFWLTGIPTWLSGAGTLGLAAFAVWAIRSDKSERIRVHQETEAERLRLRQETGTERARGDALMKEAAERVERQQRREQASQVAVWIDAVDLHGKDFVSKDLYLIAGRTNAAIVRNNSLLPIYDVEVTFFTNGSIVREDNFELHLVPLVPPQGQKELEVPYKLASQVDVSAGVSFRDANGIRWNRDPHGALGETT